MLDSIFFTREYIRVGYLVSERKQIALIRHEKLFEISRAVLRDKSLRNEDYHERKNDSIYTETSIAVPW